MNIKVTIQYDRWACVHKQLTSINTIKFTQLQSSKNTLYKQLQVWNWMLYKVYCGGQETMKMIK